MREGHKLGSANRSKVGRVREQNNPFPCSLPGSDLPRGDGLKSWCRVPIKGILAQVFPLCVPPLTDFQSALTIT